MGIIARLIRPVKESRKRRRLTRVYGNIEIGIILCQSLSVRVNGNPVEFVADERWNGGTCYSSII